MKIYTRVVFDTVSGRVEEADSYGYDGPIAYCGGGKNKTPQAPDYSPVMAEDLAFRRQQYAESKPLTERLIGATEQSTKLNMALAEENAQRQREQYERYKSTYAPTELNVAADAYGQQYLNADEKAQLQEALRPDSGLSEADRQQRLAALSTSAEERAGTEAQGSARANINEAATQQGRMLGRYGADPSRMAAIVKSLSNQQALALTNASNTARQSVRDRGVALRANLANTGRGFINTSASLGSLASGQAGAGVGAANTGSTAGLQNAQFMAQGFGNQAAWMNQGFQNQMSAYEANQKANDMSGIGSLVGMGAGMMMGGPMGAAVGAKLGGAVMADGGMVRGPGTGTSDSVRAINVDDGSPIRLSNGEFVLPADTTRALGKAALDQLVRKTHTPVRRTRAL